MVVGVGVVMVSGIGRRGVLSLMLRAAGPALAIARCSARMISVLWNLMMGEKVNISGLWSEMNL